MPGVNPRLGDSGRSHWRGDERKGVPAPYDISHEQEEGVSGRGAEVGAIDGDLRGKGELGEKEGEASRCPCQLPPSLQPLEVGAPSQPPHHDVSIPVEELDEFLQAPEAAFETSHEELGKFVLGRWKKGAKGTIRWKSGGPAWPGPTATPMTPSQWSQAQALRKQTRQRGLDVELALQVLFHIHHRKMIHPRTLTPVPAYTANPRSLLATPPSQEPILAASLAPPTPSITNPNPSLSSRLPGLCPLGVRIPPHRLLQLLLHPRNQSPKSLTFLPRLLEPKPITLPSLWPCHLTWSPQSKRT